MMRKRTNIEEEKDPGILADILDFMKTLIICVLIVFGLVHWVARPIRVQGDSMYPTLQSDAIGFSDIIGLNISGLHRFDVVIIYMPEEKDYLVKRVIGLPGETVRYEDGQLYINDEPIAENFLDQEYVSSYSGQFTRDMEAVTLASDEYWCMGDNRPYSSDSRHYGAFKRSQIVSRGTLILYPFSEFGVLTW